MAAVPLKDGKWWIARCIIHWSRMLIVSAVGRATWSGYPISDVTHYYLIEEPVK